MVRGSSVKYSEGPFEDGPDNGCGELSQRSAVQARQSSDRNRLDSHDAEQALMRELLKSSDAHLVQAAFHLGKPVRTVGPDVIAPADERALAEDQVRPREHGKEVTTV